MNHVTLTGRFTHNIELRTNQNNKSVVNTSLAVDRPFKNKDGERETDFINITAFNKTAELINEYCKKGDKIGIEGRIQNNKVTQPDGTNKYYSTVVVENVEFMEKKRENNSETEYTKSGQQTTTTGQEDPYADFGQEIALSDDDLPF